ncbi:MAG: hypothetical protein AB7T49_07080 [Oligoflexales bacterium]
MNMKKLALSFALLGCRSVSSSQTKASMNPDEIGLIETYNGAKFREKVKPIECQEGKYESFYLKPTGTFPLPTAEQLGIPPVDGLRIIDAHPQGETFRLDTCFVETEERAIPKRLVSRDTDSYFYVTNITTASTIQGLNSAIFGDYSGFHLSVPGKHKSFDDSFLYETYSMFGAKAADGQPIVAAIKSLNPDKPMDPSEYGVVLLGLFELGDPFSEGCDHGLYKVTKLKMETANLEIGACVHRSVDGFGFVVKEIALSDDHQGLPTNFQAKFTGTALETVFKQKRNHHNDCDSMMLTLPEATYWVTAVDHTGYCNILEGAPSMSQGTNKAKFRIQYSGQAQDVTGSLDVEHFITP